MATYKCTVVNAPNGLRCRTGPGTSYAESGKIYNGTTFTSNETKKGAGGATWYKNSATGLWSCSMTNNGIQYLKVTSDNSGSSSAPKPTTPTSSTNNSSVNKPQQSNQDAVTTNAIYQKYIQLTQNKTNMIEQSIDGSVRLFGLPHQFTQYTDYRISDKTNLGRVFAETFVLDAPRVFLKPGTSNFLPGMSEAERKGFMQAIKDLADNDSSATSLKQKLDQGMFGDKNVKYFEFEQRFDKYMSRVNLLCRVGAVFMDVNKVKVPWDRGSTVTFGNYDWRHYKFKSTFTGVSNVGKNPESALNGFDISSFLSSIALDDSYVEFYVDASASYSESASNSTTQSMLTSFTDSLSSVGKELAFISGATGVAIDNLAMSTSDSVENAISSIAKGDSAMANLLRRLTGTSNQLISGGNFIAPDIWSDSDYSKSYSFSIILSTPYGNPLSWYLNIWVPLAHLLAMALPIQMGANAFTSPSLIKAFSPGWFSCDLGIIDSISIEKGSNNSWATNGLPNEISVSLSVRDLYSSLALPEDYSVTEFFANDNLINFLMVTCGVDISNQAFLTKYEVMANMFANTITENITAPFHSIVTTFKEKARSIYGLYT
jgi:hypothetical protein